MISKPHTDFIKCVKQKAYSKIINAYLNHTELPYHAIGKELLHECYQQLHRSNNWTYSHISSQCQEYDTKGNKLNNILIEFNWKDCMKERIFFPLYNTAPGYPEWFKELTKKELTIQKTSLTPLIEMSFQEKSICLDS